MTKEELKARLAEAEVEFAEACRELGEKLDAFDAGLISERELDFYGECAAEVQNEIEELKAELATA